MEEVEVLCVGLYLAEEHLKANGFSVVQVVLKYSEDPVALTGLYTVQLRGREVTASLFNVQHLDTWL